MRFTILAVALLAAAIAGCGTAVREACTEGEVRSCACETAGQGSATCDDDGQFGECACPGVVAWMPGSLDFGEIPAGTPHEASIALVNNGALAVQLGSVMLAPGSDPRFELTSIPTEVPPKGAVALVVVAFSSEVPTVASGAVRIEVPGRDAPIEVPLAVRAYGPAFECSPTRLDFGTVTLGVPKGLPVTCRNVSVMGATFDGVIWSPAVASDDPEFGGGPEPWVGLVGLEEEVTFEVTYLPLDDEDDETSVFVVAEGVSIEVEVTGEALLPACELELPTEVLLAGVPTEELGGEVIIQNNQPGAGCLVERIEPGEECGAEFSFGMPPGPTVIPPGQDLALPFTFEAGPDQGRRSCDLRVFTGGPTPHTFETTIGVELSWRPCLVLEGSAEIPAISPSCGPSTVELALSNRCNRDFVVGDVRFSLDSTPGFNLTASPPKLIPARGSSSLTIEFDPDDGDSGPVSATLEIQSPLDAAPWRFPVTSEALVDHFRYRLTNQPSAGPLDVLVVIDNGLGMAAEQPRILEELGSMPTKFFGWDFRLAVTTTGVAPAASGACPGGASGGENGRFFPIDGSGLRVISPATEAPLVAWQYNLQVGACHEAPARPFASAIRGLDYLSRVTDDSTTSAPDDGNAGLFPVGSRPLLVVFVGDRDDASPGTPWENWTDLRETRQFQSVRVVVIAGPPSTGCVGSSGVSAAPGDRLFALVGLAGGTVISICDDDWDFFGPYDIEWSQHSCFKANGFPADLNLDGVIDAQDVEVMAGGESIPPVADDGSINWSWNPEELQVCFERAARPPPGVVVKVRTLSCGGEE